MKNYLRLIIGMFGLAIVGCSTSNDDDSNGSNPTVAATIADVKSVMSQGSWRVSYYFEDVDETLRYANYVFTFNSAQNTVTVTGGGINVTGGFSVTDSSLDDNADTSEVDFNLSFTTPAALLDLTDDWDIVTFSNNEIVLIDVSGGNGGTDNLRFSKI